MSQKIPGEVFHCQLTVPRCIFGCTGTLLQFVGPKNCDVIVQIALGRICWLVYAVGYFVIINPKDDKSRGVVKGLCCTDSKTALVLRKPL